MNQINLIGNIGAEPEVRVFSSGKHKVARFSVAVNSYSKDKDRKQTMWVSCDCWDVVADRLLKCLETSKLTGRKIQVSGSLACDVYEKNGSTVRKHYIKVQTFELLPAGNAQQSAGGEQQEAS